ncbi:Protein of unknown function [Alteribacillus persepolensis]|uniref:Uncharacterized protein n=1 Tax=Alteribacillus persepolensis TaxID=568899 RepID=A0A1G7ZF66_9BACI|nr:YpiF family protein [Alteribacillus persepolensis]SDH07207.1 Protein of unknown function [Alteribacillus persepolensis]
MKWITNDIASFIQERKYIDTALVPLLPVTFGSGVRQSAAMNEFISIISDELERQFKGRMLLVPPFTYLETEDIHQRKERLLEWAAEMKKEGTAHIIYITADSEWKKAEQSLGDLLVWMPLVPLENMDMEYKRQVVSEQIKQLIPLIMEKWKMDT